MEKQIPKGNDRKKSKGNGKCRGALRCELRAPVEMTGMWAGTDGWGWWEAAANPAMLYSVQPETAATTGVPAVFLAVSYSEVLPFHDVFPDASRTLFSNDLFNSLRVCGVAGWRPGGGAVGHG